MSSLSTSLKNSYQQWLHPYEEYLKLVKPGVHQQLEYEYGGPLTPSPAPSPKKFNQDTPSNLHPQSPAGKASNALNTSIKREPEAVLNSSAQKSPPASCKTPVMLRRGNGGFESPSSREAGRLKMERSLEFMGYDPINPIAAT